MENDNKKGVSDIINIDGDEIDLIKANCVTGLFDGFLFSSSWAMFFGPLVCYEKNIKKPIYM